MGTPGAVSKGEVVSVQMSTTLDGEAAGSPHGKLPACLPPTPKGRNRMAAKKRHVGEVEKALVTLPKSLMRDVDTLCNVLLIDRSEFFERAAKAEIKALDQGPPEVKTAFNAIRRVHELTTKGTK